MAALLTGIWKFRIWKDTHGQDLVEYALMAGFVATAGAAALPGVSAQLSTVFSSIAAQLQSAGGGTPNVSPAG